MPWRDRLTFPFLPVRRAVRACRRPPHRPRYPPRPRPPPLPRYRARLPLPIPPIHRPRRARPSQETPPRHRGTRVAGPRPALPGPCAAGLAPPPWRRAQSVLHARLGHLLCPVLFVGRAAAVQAADQGVPVEGGRVGAAGGRQGGGRGGVREVAGRDRGSAGQGGRLL